MGKKTLKIESYKRKKKGGRRKCLVVQAHEREVRGRGGQLYLFAVIILFVFFIGILYITFYQAFTYIRNRMIWYFYPSEYSSTMSTFVNDIWYWLPAIALIGGLLLYVLAQAQKRRGW